MPATLTPTITAANKTRPPRPAFSLFQKVAFSGITSVDGLEKEFTDIGAVIGITWNTESLEWTYTVYFDTQLCDKSEAIEPEIYEDELEAYYGNLSSDVMVLLPI